MILSLNHVGHTIRNTANTVDFYQKHLGARVVREAMIPATNTACTYLQIANGLLELICPGNQDENTKFGLDHVAFIVDDIATEHQRLLDAGLKQQVAPKIAGTGYGKISFLLDANNIRIELIERDESFRTPPTPGVALSYDHISLNIIDLEAAEKVYVDVLGMKVLKKFFVESKNLDIWYLTFDDQTIEFLHTRGSTKQSKTIPHIAVRVENSDELTKTLQENGVEFLPGNPKDASIGDFRTSSFLDLDNGQIELLDRDDLRNM